MFSSSVQKIISYLYNLIFIPKPPNLIGDRDVEYSFIAANLPNRRGKLLDFGSGKSHLSLLAALSRYHVTAIDLLPNRFTYEYENIKFLQGDISKQSFANNYFDIIINCSSIEHVGLAGRYGVAEPKINGDFEVMDILFKILKRGGLMLLTIPVAKDTVIKSSHRIYGKKRLPKLLSKFKIKKEVYWKKNPDNRWVTVSKQKALGLKPSEHYYNIGCYVLSK